MGCRWRRSGSAAALAAVAALLAACQGAPEATTDLFLIDVWTDGGLIRVGEPRNLTERAGYDNQPSWSADGSSIYYASRSGDASDVYRYDLDTDEAVRITRTEDKEYSPQEIPSGDGITAVRLERNNSLRVWRYDADGQKPAPLLQSFRDNVRYYGWIDEDTVALSVGQQPAALYLARVADDEVRQLPGDVGRSFNPIPGQAAMSFVLKDTPAEWWIARLDLETGEITRLGRTLQGVEDHAWLAGRVLMGAGSKLYGLTPGESGSWEEIADFSTSGLTALSRIAVRPQGDQLVVASEVR